MRAAPVVSTCVSSTAEPYGVDGNPDETAS
jgi:hypothetical protein